MKSLLWIDDEIDTIQPYAARLSFELGLNLEYAANVALVLKKSKRKLMIS